MEIDKKALAVTRLVSVIYNWDPNLGTTLRNQTEREKVLQRLLKEALPNPDSQKRAINMVLAMTLLTSGHVATVRNPEGYNEKKSGTWATITSDPAKVFLKTLGFPYYKKITRQDYENAKKLLPVIGSSSMLESEVRDVFQATQVSKDYPKITGTMDRDKYGDLGVGGYEYLHRGLSNMSEAAIIRVTDIGSTWDSTRGVSTSFDQRSAAGFADTPNSILFSFKNPKRRGFNALRLSKYRTEQEVILSGVSRIDDYQLSFTAKNSTRDYDTFGSKYLTVEVTPSMIFIREGLKPKYMAQNLSSELVHEFVKKALTFEEIQLKARDGDVIKLNAFKDTCKIICTGEIL